MDPHLLRTFVAVARTGSFSTAAHELGFTQSAVSQHVATLEGRLGLPLLHRRPVAPTEAGARLLEHAEPILLRIDAARADLARLTGTPSAAVAAGTSPLAVRHLADALATARGALPRLDVTVRVTGRAQVVEAVTTGTLDLGLVDGVTAPNDPLREPSLGLLTAVGVAEDDVAVALPADHPLAGRSGLRLTELVDAWWLDAPDTAAPLDQLRYASATDGFRPLLRYEGGDVAGLLALVAAGHGLAVLPRTVTTGSPGVVGVPVTAPRVVHRVELVHGRLDATAARTLADLLHG